VTLAQFLRDYGSRQQFTFDDENTFSENITVLTGGK